jgi:hypothetical protein
VAEQITAARQRGLTVIQYFNRIEGKVRSTANEQVPARRANPNDRRQQPDRRRRGLRGDSSL